MRRIALLLSALIGCATPGGGLQDDLDALRAVGPEGAGHAEASRAWKAVVGRGPEALLPILAAFDGADPRAANWLRAAADTVATNSATLDAKGLEAFVLDTRHDGEARKLAYDWLVRADPAAPDRLLPGMLDDPGRELRREAVARAAAATQEPDALSRLLPHARDRDQVDALAKRLKAAGRTVDLQAHYGVIARWTLITSFDNTGMKGFDVPYPPEKGVDPKVPLAGKGGLPVRFVDVSTPDPVGKVDLNASLGKEMGAVAYALAEIESGEERPVEIRVGTNNAMKIFLNGKQLFFRNEYHHGMQMDQYVGRGRLLKGRNEVLLKICQNEQKEDWAQSWSFQARLADALGGAVPFRSVAR